jgi:hypothetical protein
LSILSIVFAFLSPVIGLILAIVGIYLGKQGQREGQLKADKAVTIGYVGLVLSVIMLVINYVVLALLWDDIMGDYGFRLL